MLAVDGRGELHDGDDLIALIAKDLQKRGELEGGVAVTVMTNYGFLTAMEEAGIEVEQTKVGDRYVIEALRSATGGSAASSPATSSGPTSRPPATASRPRCSSCAPSRGAGSRTPSPSSACRSGSRTCGWRTAARSTAPMALWSAVEEENRKLEGRGRVLVRASGTEPLLRVMVEAPDEEECEAVTGRLVDLARAASSSLAGGHCCHGFVAKPSGTTL